MSEWRPDPAVVRAFDEQMSRDGVAIHERPDKAVLMAVQAELEGPLDLVELARGFRRAFQELHPSIDWSPRPFVFLCACARGIAYEVHPPVVFGSMRVDPMASVKITRPELERLHRSDAPAFDELYFQAADALDLFWSDIEFRPHQPEAVKMLSVATGQLEASARQLVAGARDGSIAQAMALAAELGMKAVLHASGLDLRRVERFGHRLPSLAEEVAAMRPGPNDAELINVASSLPAYVASRYSPPPLTAAEAQDLYRRGLFVAAEALRRTGAPAIYWRMRQDASVPDRVW